MKIVNIVAVAKMEKPFELEELYSKLNNTEMASTWLKMRLQPENYYIAFYKSGKFLITGIKDIKMVDTICSRVINLLKDAHINNSLANIEIKNLVMTDEIDLKSSLHHIILNLKTASSSYEPETFPGLFYKDDSGISYTLFGNGKIIITGFVDQELADNNLKKFKELIYAIS